MNDDHEDVLDNTFFEELEGCPRCPRSSFFPMRKPKTWAHIWGGHVRDNRDVCDVHVLDLTINRTADSNGVFKTMRCEIFNFNIFLLSLQFTRFLCIDVLEHDQNQV